MAKKKLNFLVCAQLINMNCKIGIASNVYIFTVAHPKTFTQYNVNIFDNHVHYPCVNVKEDIYLAGNVSKDLHIHSFSCCIYEYFEHLQQYSVYDPGKIIFHIDV
jgi:hypothetical protein